MSEKIQGMNLQYICLKSAVSLKKKIAGILGIVGFASVVVAAIHLYKGQIAGALIFSAIAAACGYCYAFFTPSNLGGVIAFLSHVTGIIALYYSGSSLYFSIPYMMLPFIAIILRNVFLEKLGYNVGLWIEPLILSSAFILYLAEVIMNHQLEPGVKAFPLVYFAATGLITYEILIDGLKMNNKVKTGLGMANGEMAPVFCLQNENNSTVCLADFAEKNNILLIFVRGEWCPMCHIMLRTYMKESAKFRAKNVFLLVIGPDPTGVNKKMAQDLKLDFHILSDPELMVSHSYRLKIKAGHLAHASKYNKEKEIPLPASFLIDKNGIIRYCSNPGKIGEMIKLPDIFPVLNSLEAASQSKG